MFSLITSSAHAWEKGYDILEVGPVGKATVLFAYDRNTGRAHKYNLSTSSGIRKRQSDKEFKWRKSWTHMNFPAGSNLRLYHSGTTGDVQLYKMGGLGKDKKTKKKKTYSKFYKGFDIVENIGRPHNTFLFYDKDNGRVKIYKYNSGDHNFGAPIYSSKEWGTGWDVMKQWYTDFSNESGYKKYLLMYSREQGKVKIVKLKKNLKGIDKVTYESDNWRHTWHSVNIYYRTGKMYALFYDKTNGHGKVFKLSDDGEINGLVKSYEGWRKSWDIVKTYNDGRYSGKYSVLFYDKHSGDVNVYKIGAGGRLTERVQSK